MKRETREILDAALEEYERRQVGTLVRDATAAYIAGDVRAQGKLRLSVSFDLVHREALEFARGYRSDLVDRGGSIIQGEFVPWLADQRQGTRSTIHEIIERGIREGKPLGVKEYRSGGGYPKGSVAADLQEYFGERKSHAATVARTETRRIDAAGARARYKASDVWGLRRLCGPNPCDECQQYCGQVYPIDEAPELPLHPNCTCDYAPVMEPPA